MQFTYQALDWNGLPFLATRSELPDGGRTVAATKVLIEEHQNRRTDFPHWPNLRNCFIDLVNDRIIHGRIRLPISMAVSVPTTLPADFCAIVRSVAARYKYTFYQEMPSTLSYYFDRDDHPLVFSLFDLADLADQSVSTEEHIVQKFTAYLAAPRNVPMVYEDRWPTQNHHVPFGHVSRVWLVDPAAVDRLTLEINGNPVAELATTANLVPFPQGVQLARGQSFLISDASTRVLFEYQP